MTITIPMWVLWAFGVPAAIAVVIVAVVCMALGFAVLRGL